MTDPTPAVPSGDAADSQQTEGEVVGGWSAAPRSPYLTHDDVRLLPDHEPTPKVWGEPEPSDSTCDCALDTEDCTDPTHAALNAVLRAARDDLHAQTTTPYHQARKREFLRRLEAGEFDNAPFAEGGDIPASDSAASSSASVEWIKTAIGELPEWQQHWLQHLAQLRSREQRRAGYEANAAYQHTMQIASGRDVPPLPATALPTRVDDLTSDTYDQLRARYAWLEQRYRDTVDSEMGAMVVRQAKEIGDRDAAIRRVRELHEPITYYKAAGQCDCPGKTRMRDHEMDEVRASPEGGPALCLLSPYPVHCACSEPYPCPTIRALDGDDTTETT
jgi:hypothetical protein